MRNPIGWSNQSLLWRNTIYKTCVSRGLTFLISYSYYRAPSNPHALRIDHRCAQKSCNGAIYCWSTLLKHIPERGFHFIYGKCVNTHCTRSHLHMTLIIEPGVWVLEDDAVRWRLPVGMFKPHPAVWGRPQVTYQEVADHSGSVLSFLSLLFFIWLIR